MKRLLAFIYAFQAIVACTIWEPIWYPKSKSADALYRFVSNDKAGFIDRNGRIVVAPTLELSATRRVEYHHGVMNYQEISAPDPKLKSRGVFSEGLAPAIRKGESVWGYVDREGRFVIPPTLLEAGNFQEGLALVVTDGPCSYFSGGPCGFMDLQVLGGKKGAKYPHCRFNYIDYSGKRISSSGFDSGRDFAEGLAPVRVDKDWGFVDRTGQMQIRPQFEDALPFSEGLARVRINGKFGFINKAGHLVIDARLERAESFNDGQVAVGDKSSFMWFVNSSGEQDIMERFKIATRFHKGLAHVELISGKFAYIDNSGRYIFVY